jgi:hypothetical protein
LVAPRRVLFCQARDLQGPDTEWLGQRLSVGARSVDAGALEVLPERALDAGLLLNWLKRGDLK